MNMNARIVFYIALCVVVLCTQMCALILLKRDAIFELMKNISLENCVLLKLFYRFNF